MRTPSRFSTTPSGRVFYAIWAVPRLLSVTVVVCALIGVSRAGDGETVFGSSEQKNAAVIGIFYDFKQTPRLEPIKRRKDNFSEIVDVFVSGGFDESSLSEFFRATRPLYATRIWMPRMKAETAPKEFGVGDIVAPRQWIAHYKGQVLPPVAGTYRFLGWSDDVLVVGLDGKVVLVANHPGTKLPLTGWTQKEKSVPYRGARQIFVGDWFTVSKDEVLDLDVVVGERPGGEFLAHLLIQNKEDGPEAIGPFRVTEDPTPGLREDAVEPVAWRAIP